MTQPAPATTLLAVTGLSPAIVTETLWALASEKPPILPERVVFITTATGAAIIEKQLFTPRPDWGDLSVWDHLRRALGASPGQLIAEPPRIIALADGSTGRTLPLDDIRSPAENAAAAEFIFGEVWTVVRDPDQRLVASIAGGRKTMGALLHSAVSLIGRETDRVTHVLVDPPYDSLPDFFYPAQISSPLLARDGRAFEAEDARLHLADVPFVPLRNRFKELDDLPGSFLNLRDELSNRLRHDAERPVPIRIDHKRGILEVDGKSYGIRARALIVLQFLLDANLRGNVPQDQVSAGEQLSVWFACHRTKLGHINSPDLDNSDIRRELNHLRGILKGSTWQPALRTLMLPPFSCEPLAP